jgi:hypothetical protein
VTETYSKAIPPSSSPRPWNGYASRITSLSDQASSIARMSIPLMPSMPASNEPVVSFKRPTM